MKILKNMGFEINIKNYLKRCMFPKCHTQHQKKYISENPRTTYEIWKELNLRYFALSRITKRNSVPGILRLLVWFVLAILVLVTIVANRVHQDTQRAVEDV